MSRYNTAPITPLRCASLAASLVLLILAAMARFSPLMAEDIAGLASQPGAQANPRSGMDVGMATFAGGCFWCMEYRFEKVPGVLAVFSGYTGGDVENPSYEEVAGGRTGHVEAIRIYYDRNEISYEGLLQTYWRIIDPTDPNGQFVDRGPQYRPIIFYHNQRQKLAAIRSRARLRRSLRFRKPVIVPIQPARTFWLAEYYHQDFYRRQSIKFRQFRYTNPRGPFIRKIWGRDLKIDYSKYRPHSGL